MQVTFARKKPCSSTSICYFTFEAVYISCTVQNFVVIDRSYKNGVPR
jgi:hypothetical protein